MFGFQIKPDFSVWTGEGKKEVLLLCFLEKTGVFRVNKFELGLILFSPKIIIVGQRMFSISGEMEITATKGWGVIQQEGELKVKIMAKV